ncbi:adult cuticle protein 1-like [Musca vetustissima]|uniref:adult cuticle protein 1-like n=1 Tax=Musca vetustissima TaxID=27455 RepID=UPI002AB5F8E4|nr:adult cuticle protein 1-like [Musca vetustissima]
MKFAIAVVLLALALGANSSVIPWGPVVVGGPVPGTVVVGAHPHAAVTVAAHPPQVVVGPGPVQVVSGPLPAVVPAPAVVAAPHVVAAPAVVPAHSGTFVAKTRGAVHVAPLAGHAQSVASVNLQPAPGTV